jgi:hypothetical protein
MKASKKLTVTPSFALQNQIAMHPNDGYDIGLFNQMYSFKIYIGSSLQQLAMGKATHELQGEILLLNECKEGTLQIAHKYWLQTGKLRIAKLLLNDEKAVIVDVSELSA